MGVQRGQSTNFSDSDENSEINEKESKNETDRFEPKRAKKDKSSGFGTNARKEKRPFGTQLVS